MTAVPLTLIRRDGGTQPRDHISVDVAKDYAEAIASGDTLPPVTVFYDGAEYWLADGFHRWEAHDILRESGLLPRPEIQADVRQGTRRDAILFSVGANADHGYRRSSADKRRAVGTLLDDPEWRRWSDNDIRRHCNVSLDMVQRHRLSVTYRTVSETPPPPAPEVPDDVRLKAKEIEEAGGVARFYKNRHGSVSVMSTGNIGSKPLPVVAGRTPDHRPDPSFGGSAVIGINEASRVTGFEPRKLASIARSGEIDGAEKESGSWQFETEKLRAWMAPTAEIPTSDPAPVSEPLTCPATGAPLLLAVADVFAQVATWPAASGVLVAWEGDIGAGIPLDHIAKAAAWMVEFTTQYPSIEQRRQITIAAALEGSAQHVA